MAGKFIELSEAAALLGMSGDELNNLRLAGEIYAVRDGSSWKFKREELERVAEDRGISLSDSEPAEEAEDMFEVEGMESGESSDLDLDLASEELDDSPTAIGRPADMDDLLGSESGLDMTLGEGVEVEAEAAARTDVPVAGGSDLGFDMESESDLNLGVEEGTSDVALVPDDTGSELNLVAGSSPDVTEATDVGLDLGGESDELDFEGSDLALDSDVTLGGDADALTFGEGDEEEIALDDDDELVLEGGSDITGGAGDTGINLASPSDSGLNLEEEPLDLAGSSVSSLELPEDEDLLDLEDLDAEPAAAAPVQADEDFQLEPSAELEEDEEDSGSQVIALEDSEAFGEVGEEALAPTEPVLGAVEQVDELEGALEAAEAAPVTQPALPESALYGAMPEMPYSIWNVLSLLSIVLILSVTGMLMTDLIRNIWTWNEPYAASTPIMDMMVNLFGLKP
jgi:hypothetical protein